MAGLTLVTGGAGSGKTARLVEVAAERYEADRFAPTLVLVPTARHADQFRRRLVERAHAVFGLDVVTINQYARRLTAGRVLPADVAGELLQRVTLERTEPGRTGGDTPAARLRPIIHTAGLHTLVRSAVSDLVADGIDPARFEAAARATTSLDLRALGDVYRAYREALDVRGDRDSAEAAALAAEALDDTTVNVPPLVLVDGVQFLRGGEAALIAALAARSDVWLTLETPEDGDADDRASWTRNALIRRVPGARTEALAARPLGATVTAATTADDEAQLREIARSIKARLDADRSLRPSDFAVVFRRVTPHLALARRVFDEYRLPLDPAAGERLAERPFGAWLLHLLRVAEHDWRLLDVLDVVASGFFDRSRFGLTARAVEGLRRTGRRHDLWGGLDALHRLPDAVEDDIAAGRGGDPDQQRAAARAFGAALEALASLLDGAPRRPGEHAARIDAALFGPEALVHAPVEGYSTLDVEIDAFRRGLHSLRAVDEAVPAEPGTLAAFVTTIEGRMQRPSTLIRQPGGVLLAPMHTLHGLRFHDVAVAGLSEGEFPAPRRTDGLLNGEARTALAEAGLMLPPEPRASEDELWRTATSRAASSTSLWRTRLDAKGRLPGVDVRWLLDPADGWSASRLESYRTCSFQFFAHYALRLEELREERDEADAATRGTVVHEVLEDAVTPLVESGRALTPETVEEALARLRENARGIWDSASQRHAFGRAALWRYQGTEAIEQMAAMLRREAEASAALDLDAIVGGEVALREALPGAPPMLVQGRVDRLDRGPGVVQIVDYKSGKFIPRRQAENGERLQLQLYALAARQAYDVDRVVARYSFLRLRGTEEEWTLDTADPEDEALLAAAAAVARDVRSSVDAGRFEVRPVVAACPPYCAFINACRVNHYTRWKTWE